MVVIIGGNKSGGYRHISTQSRLPQLRARVQIKWGNIRNHEVEKNSRCFGKVYKQTAIADNQHREDNIDGSDIHEAIDMVKLLSTIEVSEWISNFTPHFIINAIPYPWWDLSQSMLVKGPLLIQLLPRSTLASGHLWHNSNTVTGHQPNGFVAIQDTKICMFVGNILN